MNGRALPHGIAALEGRPLRLPRAGIIRLGEKGISKSGKEYPRELDYLNVLPDAEQVAKFYSDLLHIPAGELRLREIDVLFPVNDLAAIVDLCYLMYGATGWKCRGDGQIAYNREHDEEIECAGEDCKMVADNKCKRQMRLTFACYLVPGLCVYQIVTSSWRSIENTLAFCNVLEEQFGRIDMIPLKLYREPYTTSYTDEDGKQHQQVHHCIRLDFAESLLNVKRLQLAGGRDLSLPEPTDECADDMYPKSLQAAEKAALPPASEPVVIEQPAIIAVPDPEPEACDEASIRQGFEILELDEVEQDALRDKYAGDPAKLIQYLSARIDAGLCDPAPPPAAKPRQRKAAEPVIEAPKTQERWGF
jgi:hypothetical protein